MTGETRGGRIADRVAARLQEMILSDTFSRGDRFPSERELCEAMGVSRTAVREAVRSLSAKGLLEVRQGGGTVVRSPSVSKASELMTMLLRVRGSSVFGRMHEVRTVLEVEIAGLAAQRRSEADISTLQQHLEHTAEAARRPEEWAAADVALHAAIAGATANPLYPVLLASMSSMLTELRLTAARLVDTPVRAQRHHIAIVEAILDGDHSAARREMTEHMREAEATFQRARLEQGLASTASPDEHER